MFHCFSTLDLRKPFTFLTALAAFSSLSLATSALAQDQDRDKDGAGVIASDKVSAKDVGLPIYPGSKPHKDNDNVSTEANLGLWGGGSGFKLVILKMESGDSPEKLVGFYKKALSKYGPVLDCSHPPANSEKASNDDSSKTLTCGDDKPDKGGYLFKSGTRENSHLVAIQPSGSGSIYQLLNVGAWSKK
jgi:hypothetical protein